MEHHIITLSIIKTITVAVGLVFLYLVGRAYAKTRARSMAVLFVAVGLFVAAAVVEGTAVQLLSMSLDQAHVLEAIVTLAGFMVLLYSVIAHRLK